jgi:hypothetical protein
MAAPSFRTTLVFKKASQDKHGQWCSTAADRPPSRDRIDRVVISNLVSLEQFLALGRRYNRAWLLSDGSERCLVSKLNQYLVHKGKLGSTVSSDAVVVPETLRQQLPGGTQPPPAPGSLLLFVAVPIDDSVNEHPGPDATTSEGAQPQQQQLPPSPSTVQGNNTFGNLLECSVCLDLLQDPILLSCPHSLCRCCAERLHGSSSDYDFVRCPICRKDTGILDADGVCTQSLLQRAIQHCDTMSGEGQDPAKTYSAASSVTGFPTKLAGWQQYFNKLELFSQVHHIDSPRMQLAMAHPPPRLLADVKRAIANLQWCLESDRVQDPEVKAGIGGTSATDMLVSAVPVLEPEAANTSTSTGTSTGTSRCKTSGGGGGASGDCHSGGSVQGAMWACTVCTFAENCASQSECSVCCQAPEQDSGSNSGGGGGAADKTLHADDRFRLLWPGLEAVGWKVVPGSGLENCKDKCCTGVGKI